MPSEVLIEYVNVVAKLKEKNQEIGKCEELANKAFEKFKKCRSEASQNSLKKARSIPLNVKLGLFRFTIFLLRRWRKNSNNF